MKLLSDTVLRVDETGPVLLGARHKETGKIVFPIPDGADAARFEPIDLATEGRIWTFTVQRFPPKNPPYIGETDRADFEAFAIGYVELERQVIVETHLDTNDFAKLRIGQPVRLTTKAFAKDAEGHLIHTFAFTPIEGH